MSEQTRTLREEMDDDTINTVLYPAYAAGDFSASTLIAAEGVIRGNVPQKEADKVARRILASSNPNKKFRENVSKADRRRRLAIADVVSPGFSKRHTKRHLKIAYRTVCVIQEYVFPILLGLIVADLTGWNAWPSILAALVAAWIFAPSVASQLTEKQRSILFDGEGN